MAVSVAVSLQGDATKTRRLSDWLTVDAVTPPPPLSPTPLLPLAPWRTVGVVGIREQFLKTSIQFRDTTRRSGRPPGALWEEIRFLLARAKTDLRDEQRHKTALFGG